MRVAIRDKKGNPLPEEIEAYETSSPHLCVHVTPYSDSSTINHVAELWTVTHMLSGAAVVSELISRRMADMVADWLKDQPIDWSQSFETISKSAPTEFQVAVLDLREKAHEVVDVAWNLLCCIDSSLVKEEPAT